MNGRRFLRLGAKALHEVASIAFGGALAACLVINLVADPGAPASFAAGRQMFAAIASYVLVPSMVVVVASGLISLAATQAYQNAVWAWVKAFLGLGVFEATLWIAGASSQQAASTAATGPAQLHALLVSERNTLALLIAVTVANVVLAVWRPRLTVTVH